MAPASRRAATLRRVALVGLSALAILLGIAFLRDFQDDQVRALAARPEAALIYPGARPWGSATWRNGSMGIEGWNSAGWRQSYCTSDPLEAVGAWYAVQMSDLGWKLPGPVDDQPVTILWSLADGTFADLALPDTGTPPPNRGVCEGNTYKFSLIATRPSVSGNP
jgi:hypothetical protein